MKIKEDCDHGNETGKLTANRARKEQFLRRDFEDLVTKIGVGDVTSPIVVLEITDFGNDWGERAWDRVSGQGGTSFGKLVNPHFYYRGDQHDRGPIRSLR